MGWYVTCEYCKEEFKYRIGCNCSDNVAVKWQTIWINSTVVDHFVLPGEPLELYYHIQKEGFDYYFCMLLSTFVGDEYSPSSYYKQITSNEYVEKKESLLHLNEKHKSKEVEWNAHLSSDVEDEDKLLEE